MVAITRDCFQLMLVTVAVVITAVSGAGQPAAPSITTQSLHIPIRYLFAEAPLKFHEPLRLTSSTSITLTRLEFIVSRARVQLQNGDWTDLPERYYHFNPLEQDSELVLDLSTSQSIRAIGFDIGLLPAINHANPARWGAGHPLNVLECNLHWGWAGGYVFLAVEGSTTQAENSRKTFLYHLGNDPNLMRVELPLPPGLSLPTSEIVFRVDKLWNGETDISPDDGGGMTHSAPADTLAPRLAHNIEKAFEIRKRAR